MSTTKRLPWRMWTTRVLRITLFEWQALVFIGSLIWIKEMTMESNSWQKFQNLHSLSYLNANLFQPSSSSCIIITSRKSCKKGCHHILPSLSYILLPSLSNFAWFLILHGMSEILESRGQVGLIVLILWSGGGKSPSSSILSGIKSRFLLLGTSFFEL